PRPLYTTVYDRSRQEKRLGVNNQMFPYQFPITMCFVNRWSPARDVAAAASALVVYRSERASARTASRGKTSPRVCGDHPLIGCNSVGKREGNVATILQHIENAVIRAGPAFRRTCWRFPGVA